MTEPYPYSMPNLHEVLDQLAGKRYYWSVDVSSFFNQIEVEEESRQYLAFVIPGGAKYEYLRTPFGCKNAPTFSSLLLPHYKEMPDELQELQFLLCSHFKFGMFLGNDSIRVSNFFRMMIHGYEFLKTLCKSRGLVIDDLPQSLHQLFMDSLTSISFQPYPNLRDWGCQCFQRFSCVVDRLCIHMPSCVHVLVLVRPGSHVWTDSCGYEIKWTGRNWSLYHNGGGDPIATKVVSKDICIPSLSCLQGVAAWGSRIEKFEVTLACEQDACESAATKPAVETPPEQGSSSANQFSNIAVTSVIPSIRVPVRVENASPMQPQETIPRPIFKTFFDFLGYDGILNTLDLLQGKSEWYHSRNSVMYASLISLLEKCLHLWAERNNEHNHYNIFYREAVESLERTASRSQPPSIEPFRNIMNKFGCFQSSQLWTTTERALLMVACSLPAYKWTNISQKNRDATVRIRGMAFMHPRISQFMRERLKEFQFINDEDFPPQLAAYTHVVLASNICHSVSLLGVGISGTFLFLTRKHRIRF
jgi:hypothetical protein